MGNLSIKGLLVAVVVLLLLNLAARTGMSSGKEQAPIQGRVVSMTSVVRGDTLFLFRTYESGWTEATFTQFDVDPADRGGPLVLKPAEPWSPLKMKDTESKPK